MDLSDFKKKIAIANEFKPSLWVKGFVNEAGLPLEFIDHKFLIDIYNDNSPLQVILKAPQVGATTMHVLKALYIASHYDKQIIYTLPTETDMYEMVAGSFNRIIAQNGDLQALVKDADTMSHKAVGSGLIRFRGTFSAKQAMMVPSDLNIHDEVDASNADVITQYETRLQAKANGSRWYFSHPSIAGYGVDIHWQNSDKKEWVITCNECKHAQILSWPDSVDMEREAYQCKRCHTILDDSVRRGGTWRPTSRGNFSGYHISQLMCPWISAKAICEAKRDSRKTEQYFYNYVLGLPYVGSENKIPSEVVLKNVVNEVNKQEDRIIIGVDTGLPIHYFIGNKQGGITYGQCKPPSDTYDPYDELEGFLKRWPSSIIMSDQGGDLIGIRKLQAKYPGRVYLVYYQKDKKSKEMVRWGKNEELGTVRVDRNNYFQWMIEQLRDIGRIRFCGQQDEWTEFAQHFDNVYREIKVAIDKPGHDVATNYGAELIWKRNGPDHFCHCLLYHLIGLERYGVQQASFIGANREHFPLASRPNNTIPARRALGKKIERYATFDNN